ncbi:hypothetical protein [Oceanobacillus sp. FSL H7-0719]
MNRGYLTVVHIVNLLLLGLIGFVALGLVVNISEPDQYPTLTLLNFYI